MTKMISCSYSLIANPHQTSRQACCRLGNLGQVSQLVNDRPQVRTQAQGTSLWATLLLHSTCSGVLIGHPASGPKPCTFGIPTLGGRAPLLVEKWKMSAWLPQPSLETMVSLVGLGR